MGVLIEGPTLVFCDTMLMVTSTYVPTSSLAKKHLGICYHALREAVATVIHRIAHISGEFNPVDVLTKLLKAAVERPHIWRILY